MSWDSYIDNLIAQSKDASGSTHCDRACIIGLDGGAPWTTAGHANALKVCEKALCIFTSKINVAIEVSLKCTTPVPCSNVSSTYIYPLTVRN